MIDFKQPPARGAYDYLLRPDAPIRPHVPADPPPPPRGYGGGPQRVHIHIELTQARAPQPAQRPRSGTAGRVLLFLLGLAALGALVGCGPLMTARGDPCPLCGGGQAASANRAQREAAARAVPCSYQEQQNCTAADQPRIDAAYKADSAQQQAFQRAAVAQMSPRQRRSFACSEGLPPRVQTTDSAMLPDGRILCLYGAAP